MTQPDEPSSPHQASAPRPVEAKGSDLDKPIGEPVARLSQVIEHIENRASARASSKFRVAATLGIAVPAIMVASGYFFMSSVVQKKCLRVYGALGTCDPLHQIAAVTVSGQLLILGVTIGIIRWSRRRSPDQRKVAGIYWTVASSAGWAVITSLFAGQWMSGNP